jgi:hypothetical protein
MTIKPGLKDFFWMAVGAIGLLVGALVMLHYHQEANPAAQLADMHRRIELVDRMRLDLSTTSDAENSAVMAVTDRESQAFADQARVASAAVAQGREELTRLLQAGARRSELDLLARFSEAYADYERIDRELLELGVRNTNIKAYHLAFGPAAESIHEMDRALSRILTENADSTSPEARRAMRLAAGAESGALRIQAMLPPHISEENDQRMDSLETVMAGEDRQVRRDLTGLAALGGPDARTATASYARFSELRAQILELSRQNTNVRSLSLSLNQKRLAVLKCQDALAALEQGIREEPVSDRIPENPR